MTTKRKLVLLGSLYLAQGLPYGFFTQALPVLLRNEGLALPLIGLAHLLMLPWALKFLWAPLVDRVDAPKRGRRRVVIVPLQIGCAIVLAGLALAAPGFLGRTPVWALAIGVLLVNLCSATQDIATDGLAVETLAPNERGLGNGLQVGAYRVGMIIGGGAMLWVFGRAGWTVAFLAMAGTLLVATLPILAHREPATPRTETPPGRLLRDVIAQPGFTAWLVILVTYKTGEWFAKGMINAWLTDAGQTIDQLGVMLGGVGFTAGLAGALLGGALTVEMGRRRALIVFGILQALAIASVALGVIAPSVPMFYAVMIAEHLTSGMATAALFTAMMDFSRKSSAGTDYTVQASIVVIATGIATLLSGFSAHGLGYAGHFILSAVMSAIGTIAVVLYRPRSPAFTFV
jgi:MFS family permease